ncbi:hypothetical protein L1785_14305 [Antribacter sp. KLBMP9083]|uniref:Uncharacterized protein n=1 Tax=Antribacter soli TaxID=2910976 RepID=A0AA41QG41_9MICO|nr:hypothetical protein [Antribacter soli]MCF4122150.1 hypothetical protein [Antribacter soli]
MDTFWASVAALVPSAGVGLLFWFAMRKIVRADRDERLALDRMDRERLSAERSAEPAVQPADDGTARPSAGNEAGH